VAKGKDWSETELRAAIRSYLDMHKRHRAGDVVVKVNEYRKLASRFGRTAKAFEYRAQNISRVLQLQGRDWLPGLVPAANVGSRVAAQIEQILADEEGWSPANEAEFAIKVNVARSKVKSKPLGSITPQKITTVNSSFARDASVRAWVLKNASGKCESCESPAPFKTFDNHFFLEVHHVRSLVDGGSDTTSNAVAVCPNCHRALHHAADRLIRKSKLYQRIDRLVPE